MSRSWLMANTSLGILVWTNIMLMEEWIGSLATSALPVTKDSKLTNNLYDSYL